MIENRKIASLTPSSYYSNSTAYSMGATMSYYADGRTNTAFDLNDSRFDRKYDFDFSARLKEAYSGVEAHGQSAPPLYQANSPYRQSYTYDEYNNVTLRSGRIWSTQSEYDASSYTNDNKNGNFGYDAAGNVTFTGYSGDGGTRTYDAAGRPVTFTSSQTWQVYPDWPSNHPDAPALETQDTFDGTGQVVKHINHTRTDQSSSDLDGSNPVYIMGDSTTTTYYVHSTVLGGKTIEELDQNGAKQTGYVYAGGAKIVTQTVAGSSNAVQIEATNPVTGATITADANAANPARQEPDPLGRELSQPLDPRVVVDPLSSSKFNDPMPIEYGPQWTGESESGMQRYVGDVAEATEIYIYNQNKKEFLNALFDLVQTGDNKYYDKMLKVLSKNPNFEISINGKSVAGEDAANALAGAMAKLPQKPPIPRPGPDPTDGSRSLTGAEQEVANAAIDAARARLKGACYDFIKANSEYDPIKVLNDLQGGGIRYRDRPNQGGEIKTGGLGSSDTIFLPNNFFNPGRTYFYLKGSSVVLDKAGFQQEVILHELRHALIGLHPNGGSGEDYNRGIRENCFKQQEGGG